MAVEYTAANFTDAITRLPEYGGYEALSGALGEAYPDATFSPYSDDSYDKGFSYASLPIGASNAHGPFTTFNPTATQRIIGTGNIYDKIYKAVWPSLTGLVNPPVAMATNSQPTEDYRVLVDRETPAGRATNNWESLTEAPDFRLNEQLYQQAPRSAIPDLPHISADELERVLWLTSANQQGPYAAGTPIPFGLGSDGRLSSGGRISPEWLDPNYADRSAYTKYGVSPTNTSAAPVDFDVNVYTDALTKLGGYGKEGLEAFAQNLNTAYPDSGFNVRSDPYTGDQLYSEQSGWLPTDAATVSDLYNRPYQPTTDSLSHDAFGNVLGHEITTYGQSPYAKELVGYDPILQQTLAQLNPAPEIEQQNADILASRRSPSSGVITTTSGGILGGTSPLTSPTSTSLTDSMPSQEEVNNTAYKDWVNRTVNVDPAAGGKDIYDLEDKGVSEDVADHNLLANSSVDELIATATSERTPYTSQVPNSANKYLQGGANAFAYSGEGGYAAERQRMLGRAPDIYQGPEVPWQRLGKDAPSDVYYGNQRVNAPTGEVVDGGGEEFDWNEWRKNRIIADIPEGAFHPGNDNWGVNVNKHYGDLETVQKEKLMEGAERYWGDSWIGTGLYEEFPTDDTEDFRFFNHDGVNKNVTDGLGKIKDIFTKTGEGVKKGKNILKGVVDELTRITERKGGRGSVTEGDPFGVSTTGVAEGLLKVLTLDFDGKKLDKQEYGNIQPAALIAAGLVPGLLGVQLANELKDLVKDSFNISGFADPEYKAGGSFANAKNNATEFMGDLARPVVHTIAKIFTDKPIDDSIKNLVKDAFGKDRAEFNQLYGPYDKDFSDQSSFRIDPNQIPADSEVDPSIGEIDTSALIDEVLKETVTETGANDNFRSEDQIGAAIAPIVNVTMPKEQETASPYIGQGVSAGPSAAAGSTLSAGPVTGEVKSIDIELPKTETKLPPSAGSGRFTYIGPTRPKAIEGDVKDIETVDLIEMVNPVDENPFTVKPDYTGRPVSAGGQPSAGRYILPDRFANRNTTATSQPTKQIEAQEPPNLPMPSVPLDKDELQARTEQLQDELETSLADDYSSTAKLLNTGMTATSPEDLRVLFTSFTAGGSKALDGTEWGYDHKDLSYPEVANIFNAININLATKWYGENDPRVVEAKSNMSNSLDNAFASIEGFDPKLGVGSGVSTYTPQTWQNLGLQPNWGNTLNIGDIEYFMKYEQLGRGGEIFLEVPDRIPTKFDLDVGVTTPPRGSSPDD